MADPKFVPYSGSTPADLTLPAPQVGGDEAGSLRKVVSESVLTREGVAVSVRKRRDFRRWTLNYNAIETTKAAQIQGYFDERVFKFQPFGSPLVEYTVRAVDFEYAPSLVSPGYYAVQLTIEEVDI
jgi:hypothetical protein